MAEDNEVNVGNEVRVTIEIKDPPGYLGQNVLFERWGMCMLHLNSLSAEEKDIWKLSKASLVQGPSITVNIIDPPSKASVNFLSFRDLLITGLRDDCLSVDTHLMHTLPIPTSAASKYYSVILSSLSLIADAVRQFTDSLFTLIIVDIETAYLHMVTCNLQFVPEEEPLHIVPLAPPPEEEPLQIVPLAHPPEEPEELAPPPLQIVPLAPPPEEPPEELAPPPEEPPKLIVPYEAPTLAERVLELGFIVYRQPGVIHLEDEEVKGLRTRNFEEFEQIIQTYDLHQVGDAWLFLGPEVSINGPAPAA